MVKTYIERFRTLAADYGIGRLAFYLEEQEGRNVGVYHGICDKLEIHGRTSLYIEGEFEGFCGSAFVENFDHALMEEQILLIQETARWGKRPFAAPVYPSVEDTAQTEDWIPIAQLMEKLVAAEQAALRLDERVSSVVHCQSMELKKQITLLADDDHTAVDRWSLAQFHIGVSTQSGEEVQQGAKGKVFNLSVGYPDFAATAKEAASMAVSKLGSHSYQTGKVSVLLTASAVCQLLDAFMPAFFAKNIQSHLSILEGRNGMQIAGEHVCIHEDPFFPGGMTRRFDDEGILCQKKALIENGCLIACLHNRSSAEKAGQIPGGNGFKNHYFEAVDTAYTNIILTPGDTTREKLLNQLGNGLIIDGFDGVFAGANAVSGDFSLIAKGYRVENGKQGTGVTQITVAGNFLELLSSVQQIGAQTEVMRGEKGCVVCPDVLVEHLMISGQE